MEPKLSCVHVIQGMSLSSEARTQTVWGWVSIVWFTLAVSVAAGQGVKLHTLPQVAARCGDTVTLTCNVSSSGHLKSLSWVAPDKTVCEYVNKTGLCEYKPNTLTLTLPAIMPNHQGAYLCKVRSTGGATSDTTVVTVQDCLEGSFINESRAECWFSGVSPGGPVYWFQGGVNLTGSASTQEVKDLDGRYTVSSAIDVQEVNNSLPYECSLPMPSARKLLLNQTVSSRKTRTGSSGNTVRPQWIFGMVVILASVM